VPTVLFFGPARDAVGAPSATIAGSSVAEVVAAAVDRFGDRLADLLPTCRLWLNGEPAGEEAIVRDDDEMAVLPPVSGG
jgi:molybdopterin synthase sulfur carrier subunit